MLTIEDLTYRIEARALFSGASARIARGWKVGLIGRNGSGKSTLLRLIREAHEHPEVRLRAGARIGHVAQEAPPSAQALIEFVLAQDEERAALLAEAETAEDGARIGDIHMRLAEIGAHSAEARAAEILSGLGFAQNDLYRPCAEFSGGWRMRAALGGVLFAAADLLLLDEPTNYLDLEGAAWLEAHLKRYPNTVLLVSHDRDMLDRAVTHVLALDQGKLSLHAGGYSQYLRKRAERTALLESQRAKQDAQRAHLQAFVDRFRAKASKARQAQSRVKMLERMQDIVVPLEERTTPFHFEAPAHLASPLVTLDGAALGYDGAQILGHVELRVDQEDRIAIVGANGQGKTTLVKSIAGLLPLISGARRAAKACRIGYFSQDQLDRLRAGESVLDHVRDLAPAASQAQVRGLAAQIGFGHEKISTKVEKLSGGEKVRLLLGLVALGKPHILILDEPTSHLDIDSREALIFALNDYQGAVLLITHDVYLAEACADRVWLVKDGRAAPYEGDLEDYRALVLAADRAPGPRAEQAPARAAKAPAPQARVSLTALEKSLAGAEARLANAVRALAALDAALGAPDLAAGDIPDLMRRRAEAARAHDQEEAAWLAAYATLDAARRARQA